MSKKILIIFVIIILTIIPCVSVLAAPPELPLVSSGNYEIIPPNELVQPYYLYYKRADGIYTLITDDEPFYLLQTSTFTNRYLLSSSPVALVAPDSSGFTKNYKIYRNTVGSPNTWTEITSGTTSALHGFRLRDTQNDPETDTYNLWIYTDKFFASHPVYGINNYQVNPSADRHVFFYNSNQRDLKAFLALGNLTKGFGVQYQILLVAGLIILSILLLPSLIRRFLHWGVQ